MTKLIDYIKSQRYGKDAHDIEREAMQDAFLSDAIDGFDTVKGNHAENIEKMRSRIAERACRTSRRLLYSGIAASLLLCLTVGGYFMFNRPVENLIAKTEQLKTYGEKSTENDIAQKGNEEIIESFAYEESQKENNKHAQKGINPSETKIKQSASTKLQKPASKNKIVPKGENSETVQNSKNDTVTELNEEFVLPVSVDDNDSILTASSVNSKAKQTVITADQPVLLSMQADTDNVEMPEPSTGWKEYRKYLKNTLRRPTNNECKDAKGTVEVSFLIDENGFPYNFVIDHSVCPSADSEAIRLVKEGCRWTRKSSKRITVEVKF